MNSTVARYYSADVLARACRLYGIAPESAQLIRSNSNLIFDCGHYILRLSHSAIRSSQVIATELDWLQYLASQKLPVVSIIPSVHQRLAEQIGGELHLTAVCFDKIHGEVVSNEQWNEEHFSRMGALLGQLHTVGNDGYPEKTRLHYPTWDELPEHHCADHLVTDRYDYRDLYRRLTASFRALEVNEEVYGLIHYDVHHGNYLLRAEDWQLLLFDFEMTCHSWFINDVAATVHYATFHAGSSAYPDFETTFLEAFWWGYERHKTLAPATKALLPDFMLYRNLLVLGFLNELWLPGPLTPEQAAGLKKVEASVEARLQRRRVTNV